MIAFGGAAPLHAARLCDKLGIARCLIPAGAGVGSAIGFLRAPFSYEATRSIFTPLVRLDADAIRSLLADLTSEASAVVRSCDATARILTDTKVYMRYAGQGWEIPVAIPHDLADAPDADGYLALFEAAYSALFGRLVAGAAVEITVWSVNARTPAKSVTPCPASNTRQAATANGQRALFDAAGGRMVQAQTYARADLATGDAAAGPALVGEDETTVVVPAGRAFAVLADGTLMIHTDDEGAA